LVAVLGIELGSTRIKAVAVDESFGTAASGVHAWENRLAGGYWTYDLDDVWSGVAEAVRRLRLEELGIKPDCLGFSAMMHGYLVFDAEGGQLAPFRTWRNTNTARAAAELTALFNFNIPQRWSVAHLYQAILDGEAHVGRISYITTLAGYVHWKLTGEKVLGIGDASGMFPVTDGAYDPVMVRKFKELTGIDWNEIAPRILKAGEPAGSLKEPFCGIPAGTPLCPPEGDAGTGMVATNSVAERTGNISAGTSIFAMSVLEKPLSGVYPEIDIVATPAGKPVAMVHCNSCTTDLDAWIKLFGEALALFGADVSNDALFETLYRLALAGDADCGGLLSYNFYAGEPVLGLERGAPLFMRRPDSAFTLPNFMRCLLYSAMAALKIGMEILEKEGVLPEKILGHGGLFKTPLVGQRLMAAALNIPVCVMETAGEGGPWGMALLAAYRAGAPAAESLDAFLENRVFAGGDARRAEPDEADRRGFAAYMEEYRAGLEMERVLEAVENKRG